MRTNIPLRDQIAELKRSINVRETLYPKFIRAGKLAPPKADEQLRCLRAALVTLQSIPQPSIKATKGA